MLTWARNQLDIAGAIIDNPGGGLLFATQTLGQVRSALEEADADRWEAVIGALADAEDAGVQREFSRAREHIQRAAEHLHT